MNAGKNARNTASISNKITTYGTMSGSGRGIGRGTGNNGTYRHWEPKMVLSETLNKAEVSFFTSDYRSNYAIKIEGITEEGIPFYHFSTIEVD